jgi:hypothetical protein
VSRRCPRVVHLASLLAFTGALLSHGCSGGGNGSDSEGRTPNPADSLTRSPTRTSGPPATITTRPTFTSSPTATPTAVPDQTPLPTRIVLVAVSAFPVGPRADFMASADFNGDGRHDLVVSSSRSKEVSVLLSDDDAESRLVLGTKVTLGDFPGWVAAGDLNQDGMPDVVVADERGGSLFIMLGNGDGSFRPPTSRATGSNPYAVVIGDFDQRNGNDLAVTHRRTNQVVLLLNDGGPSPAFVNGGSFDVGAGPADVLAADFNGDGALDLVTLNTGGAQRAKDVTLLLFERMSGNRPVFRRAGEFGAGDRPSNLRVGDLNGDGRPDLAILNQPFEEGGVEVGFLFARSDGLFVRATPMSVTCFSGSGIAGCRPRALAIGDLNGDGTIDLAVAAFSPGGSAIADSLRVFANVGDGSFAPGETFAAQPETGAIVVADVTDSGLPEVVLTSQARSSVQIQLNVTDRRNVRP